MDPEPPRSAPKWFYVHNGGRQGPAGVERIVDLILTRELPETAPVWHPSLPAWTPAREVAEIRAELPPPVPAAAPPEADPPEADPPAGPSPGAHSTRRRRRRRHHHQAPAAVSWILPVSLLVAGLFIGLLVLLYRMNRLPPTGVTLP